MILLAQGIGCNFTLSSVEEKKALRKGIDIVLKHVKWEFFIFCEPRSVKDEIKSKKNCVIKQTSSSII